ncbi:hypothetical protein [Acrocarpospora macrocephala]|uniref:hypothetical protein n=1 Tax=Acrocarpospora macrocephala TaxID=150177 RepID=UPI0012D36F2E
MIRVLGAVGVILVRRVTISALSGLPPTTGTPLTLPGTPTSPPSTPTSLPESVTILPDIATGLPDSVTGRFGTLTGFPGTLICLPDGVAAGVGWGDWSSGGAE